MVLPVLSPEHSGGTENEGTKGLSKGPQLPPSSELVPPASSVAQKWNSRGLCLGETALVDRQGADGEDVTTKGAASAPAGMG